MSSIAPFVPMEPISQDKPFDHPDYTYQIKWDGVRLLAYYNRGQLHLANRKKKPRIVQYPELMQLTEQIDADSCIVDGEVIAFGPNGRPHFPEVLKRDLTKAPNERLMKHVPILYMLFDIVFLNDRWLLDTPFVERQHLLKKTVQTNNHVQICDNYPHGIQLFHAIRREEMEGIVAKQLNGHYFIERKHHTWIKIKNWRTLTCVVGGVTLREKRVNAVLLGMYHHDKLCFIGRAGSGLTDEYATVLTELVHHYAIDKPAFSNPPSFNNVVTKWLPPGIHIIVRYLEWTTRGTLRSPIIVKLCT